MASRGFAGCRGEIRTVVPGRRRPAADRAVGVPGHHVRPVAVRRGGEFIVNTYTIGIQRRVDVASNAAGQFVVVWQTLFDNSPYPNRFDILAQRYDADGARAGGEVDVTADPDADDHPSVGIASDGSFVVVWEGYDYDNGYHIAGRRFGSGGLPNGGEFVINSTPGTYYTTAVDSAPDGAFVVAWSSYSDPADGDDSAVRARRFDAAGAPVGSDFSVNTYTTGFQDSPKIARASDGSFVLVWQDTGQDAVVGRRYDPTGSPLGGEFVVSAPTLGFWGLPAWPAPRTDASWWSGTSSGSTTSSAAATTPRARARRRVRRERVDHWLPGPADVFMAADGSFIVAWLEARPWDPTATSSRVASMPPGRRSAATPGQPRSSGRARLSSPLAIDGAADGHVWWPGGAATEYGSDTDIIGQRFAGTVGYAGAPARLPPQTAARGVLPLHRLRAPTRACTLVWNWTKGEATALGDFGDPLGNDAFAFCVYDGSASPQPVTTLIRRHRACASILLGSGQRRVLRYLDHTRSSGRPPADLLRSGGDAPPPHRRPREG
jgi:hypothetical protein